MSLHENALNAARRGELPTLKHFIAQGTIVDNLIFRAAAENGHLEIVKYLVEEQGISVPGDQDIAIFLAAENGYFEVVDYLVQQGADIHTEGDSIFQFAAKYGKLDLVKYFIEKESPESEPHETKKLFCKNLGVPTYLSHIGVSIYDGRNLSLKMAARSGQLAVFRYLIEKGADIRMICIDDVKLAVQSGGFEMFRCLTEEYDIPVPSFDNQDLRMAAGSGTLLMVVYLVERHNLNVCFARNLVLQLAAQNGHAEIVEYLLSKGANIHDKDEIILRFAARNNRPNIVKIAVGNGANVHIRDNEALRWAREQGHQEIVEHLESL